MKRIKHINMAPYEVTYVDLREPKPRDQHKEIYVLDTDAVDAACSLGIVLADHIKERYASRGYHVTGIKAQERFTAYVDLTDLYRRQYSIKPQEVEP